MALKSSYISVLKAIKEAPHALQVSGIAAATGINPEEVTEVATKLCEMGYLKFAADNSGYFTRRPKRDEIASFLEGRTETLEGIVFDGIRPIIPESDYRQILRDIINAPEALPVTSIHPHMDDALFNNAICELKDAMLIKEHAQKLYYYFTRKPMRDKIRGFIDGRVSFATLMDPNVKSIETTDAPVAPAPTAEPEMWLKDGDKVRVHNHPYYLASDIGYIIPKIRGHRGEYQVLICGQKLGFYSYELELVERANPTPATAAATPTPAPTTYLGLPEEAFRRVLSEIYNSDHALCINGMYAVGDDYNLEFSLLADILTEGGLIKEHRDLPNHYFTRKPMRRAIELFLEGEIGADELFDRAAKREAAREVGNPEAAAPQTPSAEEDRMTPLCETDEAFEAYLFDAMDANLLVLRAAIDAAQRAYDALAAYRGR